MDVRPCHEKVNQSRDVTAVLLFRRRPWGSAVGKDLQPDPRWSDVPAPQKDHTGGWLGRDGRAVTGLAILGLAMTLHGAAAQEKQPHNVILSVLDGLRALSVTAQSAPTMAAVRDRGVNFKNSYSMFPTFSTANAASFATGHYPGDTGDFSNTIYVGYPVKAANGSMTPFRGASSGLPTTPISSSRLTMASRPSQGRARPARPRKRTIRMFRKASCRPDSWRSISCRVSGFPSSIPTIRVYAAPRSARRRAATD
jgi:hypothetical protein